MAKRRAKQDNRQNNGGEQKNQCFGGKSDVTPLADPSSDQTGRNQVDSDGNYDYSYVLNGSLDEVAVFSRVLSPDEIKAIYNSKQYI